MRIKMLRSGKEVDAKYFKNMTEREIKFSTMFPDAWEDEDVFVHFNDIEEGSEEFDECMVYLYDYEYKIIEE